MGNPVWVRNSSFTASAIFISIADADSGCKAALRSTRKEITTLFICCNSLSQRGVSVFVLAELAGHRSIQTTQRYVTVNDEMKRNAAELI